MEMKKMHYVAESDLTFGSERKTKIVYVPIKYIS